MFETIILDLDGPLLDGRQRHYQCYRGILEENGFSPIGIESYWRSKRERVDRRHLLALSGADALYDIFLQRWQERIEQPEFLALDRLQSGVLQKLDQWRNEGRRLILATLRHNPHGLHAQLEQLQLAPRFAHVVPCAHAGGAEGKAEQVRSVVGASRAEACLWIGDTEIDVAAARALGCPIWALECGLRTKEFLASLAPDFLSAELNDVDLRRWNEH